EQPEMQRDRYAEDRPGATSIGRFIDQLPGDVAERRTAGEQKAEAPIPLRIEIIAGDDQYGLLRREAGVEHRHRRRDDQEEQQEPKRREQHWVQSAASGRTEAIILGKANSLHMR